MLSCVNVAGIRTRGPVELNIPVLPDAACKGYKKVNDFHPEKPGSNVSKARAVCARCPVGRECLDWVMDLERTQGHRESGIWGGLTEWEREKLREDEPKEPRRCRSGKHLMTDDNIYVLTDGSRTCLACRRLTWRVKWLAA